MLSEKAASKIKNSSMLFGLGSAMFVATVAMTALGGTLGGVMGAALTGIFFGTAISSRTREQMRK